MTPSASRADVSRPRRWAVAAGVAALATAAIVALLPGAGLASPGPLSSQHRAASLSCSACHAGGSGDGVADAACTRCHGRHPSTRPAHAALEARGELRCSTCHVAHAPVEAVRTSAGTVPAVPLGACAGCHDAQRSADPVRACLGRGAWTSFSTCLDEHQSATSALPAAGVCRAQHGPSRPFVWEAARTLSPASPVLAAGSLAAPWLWVAWGMASGMVALFVAKLPRRRRGVAVAPAPPAPRVRLPRIDATSCLGCQACVDACPFEVLDVEKHLAVVARPDACCGVGTCEAVCPNGSLRLVEHDAPLVGVPRVDAHLESEDVPGIFVAGDLSGVPLIRHAIRQGVRVAERVHATRREHAAEFDLLVVGAGPAGVAAALRARELGLRCAVLEQSELAASIRAFPRGKIVHDAPLELPLEGPLWLRESTREELVAQWTRIVRTHRLDVREGHRVTGIRRSQGGFDVSASSARGEVVLRADRVLLAIGRRGTPRALDCEGSPDARARVMASLSDAHAWRGSRVVVVGLGDSALEAATALARQPGTTVTLVARANDFTRGSRRNVAAVTRLVELGRIALRLGTRVARVDPGRVVVEGRGGRQEVPADGVFALLGGEPSRALLVAAGLRVPER